MQRISNYVRLQGSGTPVANAAVNVYDVGTLVSSVIYSDDGVTLKANPFTADANGFWFFYAASGVYDLRFSGSTIPTPFTWAAISAFDVTDNFPGNTSIAGDLLPATDSTYTVGGNSKLWAAIKAVLLIPENGSAGAPSHSFRNAATTGMWWDSASSLLRWAFGGANRLWLSNTALTVDADFNPNTPDTYKAGSSSLRWLEGWINTLILLQGCRITSGAGSPEGVVTGVPGSIYLNRTGGASVSVYFKESGTGNTGWVAK